LVAIVYARVSSEDQARTGFSLPSQVEAARRRAGELGATETVEFADEGVPGDVLERPGLQGALEAIRRGGVSLFICFDPDRMARSLSLQLLVTDQVERAGTRLEFVNFEYKNTPEGQLFYSLRGAISQFEKAKIRERTMRGKRQKAKSGGLTHNPNIFGYDFDRATDLLSINAQEATVVRLVFHWFLAEDLGPWTIAQRLTDLGVSPARGGRKWSHCSVRSMLRNESYTGTHHQQMWDFRDARVNKYRAKGEKVPRRLRPQSEWLAVRIPAIIEESVYRAALSKLANARRWWSGWRRAEFLLSGLCRCALCGSAVSGAARQFKSGPVRFYVCRGYSPGIPGRPRCTLGRVRADDIEQEVWAQVRRIIFTPGHLKKLFEAQPNQPDVRTSLDLYRRQLAQLQAEHERTVRLLVRGTVDQSLGEQLLQEQKGRMAGLNAQIGCLAVTSADLQTTASQIAAVEDLRSQLLPVIDRLPFEQRQQTVRTLCKAVELTAEETVIHTRVALERHT